MPIAIREKINAMYPKRFDRTFKNLISKTKSDRVCLDTNLIKIYTLKALTSVKNIHACLKTKIGKILTFFNRLSPLTLYPTLPHPKYNSAQLGYKIA